MRLVAVLQTLTYKTIKAKFILVGKSTSIDVTEELFKAIQKYNEVATTKIPYTLKNGVVTYSFGCGLTHYLQQSNLNAISEYCTLPIKDAQLNVFTPDDCKHILGISPKSENMEETLLYHYN